MENTNVNTSIVKELNTQLIKRAILKLGNVTKSQVARETGLSTPTTNKLIDELVIKGEVIDTGDTSLSGGRNAKLYCFNKNFSQTLCMHFEKNEIWYQVVNLNLETVLKASVEVIDFEHLLQIDKLIEDTLLNFENIKAISIGVPAGVKEGKLFFIPDYIKLSGFNLEKHIREKFNIPVIVENDVNAAILGYHSLNEELSHENLVAIYLGSNGPGSGILVNGTLIRGFSGFAGEIGFMKIENKTFQEIVTEGSYKDSDFATIILSICTIINPKRIVLFSFQLEFPEIASIRVLLEKNMPIETIPEIIEEKDWHYYYMEGLKILAQELLEKGYTLKK